MFEFFPGNYKWSYNTLLAFSGGGQLGDIAPVIERLRNSQSDQEWLSAWGEAADIASRRAQGAASEASAWQHYLHRSTALFRNTSFLQVSRFAWPLTAKRLIASTRPVTFRLTRLNGLKFPLREPGYPVILFQAMEGEINANQQRFSSAVSIRPRSCGFCAPAMSSGNGESHVCSWTPRGSEKRYACGRCPHGTTTKNR